MTYSPEEQVTLRSHLPDAIQKTLLESARESWEFHPRYSGKAQFFIEFHKSLLTGSNHLGILLEQLLDSPLSELTGHPLRFEVARLGSEIIKLAHHHHRIEDTHYFPAFARIYPAMVPAMALLDNDHKMLGATLDGLECVLRQDPDMHVTHSSVGLIYERAIELQNLLARHLFDEEEIIVPIFLQNY